MCVCARALGRRERPSRVVSRAPWSLYVCCVVSHLVVPCVGVRRWRLAAGCPGWADGECGAGAMAAKLKDALFLGDYEAAQDLEFVIANKITHIINCAGRDVPNSWEKSVFRCGNGAGRGRCNAWRRCPPTMRRRCIAWRRCPPTMRRCRRHRYLTYFWPESGNCIIFDESNAVLDEIYTFIEEALEACASSIRECICVFAFVHVPRAPAAARSSLG